MQWWQVSCSAASFVSALFKMNVAAASGTPVNGAVQSDGDHAEAERPPGGVLDELLAAVASARALFSNFLDLLAIEARRAGLALVWMVVWGLVAAICVVGAWVGAMAALAMWAVSLGCPPIAAVVAVSAINLLAGAALFYLCFRTSRALLFSATRRQLAGECPARPRSP